MMAASLQNFRTALYGFNRDDVVQYLENVKSKHEAKVAQLRDDLNQARQEADTLRLREPAQDLSPRVEELEMELDLHRQELERLKDCQCALDAAKAELEAANNRLSQQNRELEALKKELADQTAALEAANRQLTQAVPAPDYTARELAAYRRAEETERRAGQRAESLFQMAVGTVADAAQSLERSGGDIDRTTQSALAAIEALQAAIRDGQVTLTRTAESLRCQKPE